VVREIDIVSTVVADFERKLRKMQRERLHGSVTVMVQDGRPVLTEQKLTEKIETN